MRSIKINAILKMLLNIFNIFVPLAVGPYISSFLTKTFTTSFTRRRLWSAFCCRLRASAFTATACVTSAGCAGSQAGVQAVYDPVQQHQLCDQYFYSDHLCCILFLMEQGSLDIYLAYSIYLFARRFLLRVDERGVRALRLHYAEDHHRPFMLYCSHFYPGEKNRTTCSYTQ